MTTDNAAAVVYDSLTDGPLVYGNEGQSDYAYLPAAFAVHVNGGALRQIYGDVRYIRMKTPPAWSAVALGWQVLDAGQDVTWTVEPAGQPPSCLVNLRLELEQADGAVTKLVHGIPVEIRGRTQFDPERHALPFANSAAEFGEVMPSREVFAATYRLAPLARYFFQGLYDQVVFLTMDAAGRPRGGMCTGMARSVLEHSLCQPGATIHEQDGAALRRVAQVWHGKQLADRAILASAHAWVTRGSRAAYLAFRQDVLARGRTELAMDVNVPRPWRRDLLAALIGSGHTVVPYALRQRSDDRAEVWVYDPNFPRAPESDQSIIIFDLANDSYHYRHVDGRAKGRPSKVLAVRQAHYRQANTAVLGGLLSLLWFACGRSRVSKAARASGIVSSLIVLLLLGWWRSRRS